MGKSQVLCPLKLTSYIGPPSRTRTRNQSLEDSYRSYRTGGGSPCRIRTYTVPGLNRTPLPVGLRGHSWWMQKESNLTCLKGTGLQPAHDPYVSIHPYVVRPRGIEPRCRVLQTRANPSQLKTQIGSSGWIRTNIARAKTSRPAIRRPMNEVAKSVGVEPTLPALEAVNSPE